MKEYDLSLLLFEVNTYADYSDIEKIIGETLVKKKWQGVECVEVFFGEPEATNELPPLVENFLKLPLVGELLTLQRRKVLRVGVFFDTANCNFSLSLPTLSQLQLLGIEIVFSCYPSTN